MTTVAALPARPRALESGWWALRALRREIFGYRFDYPVEVVREAGPRDSLHYYIHSNRLFFDVMELDISGVPVQHGRTFGRAYNPSYVAWYGLTSLEAALRTHVAGRRAFDRQLQWLVEKAIRRPDGSAVWTYDRNWREGHCVLKAPWISAMAQGLAISTLVRGHRLTGRSALIDLATAAARVFDEDVADGGLRTLEAGHALYEEYPAYPLPRVLDGFLFSLLGLYDLWVETGDRPIRALFEDGIRGLTHQLAAWDYRGMWSWYGSHGYLSPPQYHRLNCALLEVVAQLSGAPDVARCARAWALERRTPWEKMEIFLVFVATKNAARVRYARQRAMTDARRETGH